MFYKTLKKVSDVCQLLDKSKYPATGTYDGVIYTNNNDGTITLNGTATKSINYNLQKTSVIAGHKYFAGFNNASGQPYLLLYSVDINVFDKSLPNEGEIITCLKTYDSVFYQIGVSDGETINNVTVYPQFIDLTEMFGAGNEPTTVTEFRQKYPDRLYPYSPRCFMKSYKTNFVCDTKNMFDIGLSTDWQDPVNGSYGYAPIFIGIGKTCTISWDVEYYRQHPYSYNIYMCVNTGEQPSVNNRTWLYHQTVPSLQRSQITVSANSTGYIYFELNDGWNLNKKNLQKYLFNENLKWLLELGTEKTDYVPHGSVKAFKTTIKTQNKLL